MVGPLIGTALATAAAAVAVAGHAVGTSHADGTVSPFGGSVPVHLAHVGRIDVDLEATAGSPLRRVTCAGLPGAGTQCFVAP